LIDGNSAMKLSTDAVLLGIFAGISHPGIILDIGTGSGILALMLAQRSDAKIVGIDIDKGSVKDAKRNFEESPWKSRLSVIHESLQGFARTCDQKFDHIVSNPPFFVNSKRSPYNSRNVSKHDEQLSFHDLILTIKSLLEPKGACSFIIPASEEINFQKIATNQDLYLTRKKLIYPKKGKIANRVLLEYNQIRANQTKKSFLIIRNEDNSFTLDYIDYTKAFYLSRPEYISVIAPKCEETGSNN